MRPFALLLFLSLTTSTTASQIYSIELQKTCNEGVFKQPNGPFAVHVFCDAGFGANVAIFLNDMVAPWRGPYEVTNRFWQNEKWSADVSEILWLSDPRYLVLATSPIYGTGEVYKLNLENQTYDSVYKYTGIDEGCSMNISEINQSSLRIEIVDCEAKGEVIEISI